MTVLDWILVGVVGGGFFTIASIIVRKFPQLSAIDLRLIARERHADVKEDLLEGRIRRKFAQIVASLARIVAPAWLALRGAVTKRYNRLVELERSYREQLKAQAPPRLSVTPEAKLEMTSLLIEARTHLEQDRPAEAEKRAIEVISLDHGNLDAYELLVDTYVRQEAYREAREVILHLLKLAETAQRRRGKTIASVAAKGKLITYYRDACEIFSRLGDMRSAVTFCRKASDAEPNSPKTLDALIQASVGAKERAIAQDALEKLEKVNPENQKLPELRELVGTLKKSPTRH